MSVSRTALNILFVSYRLVCEVHYTTPAGLQESFRKFFKFQVLKPLDVKTKFYNAETDEVYLEAQVSCWGQPWKWMQ